MEIIVVDGYNIINYWPELVELAKENLENARIKLLDYLANYQGYKGIRVVAVFDAHLSPGGERIEKYNEVEVVFTKEGQTADQYIERLVRKLGGTGNVRVATSDYLIQTIILGGGATRIPARELINEVLDQNRTLEQLNREDNVKKHYIESRLAPGVRDYLDKLRNKE